MRKNELNYSTDKKKKNQENSQIRESDQRNKYKRNTPIKRRLMKINKPEE